MIFKIISLLIYLFFKDISLCTHDGGHSGAPYTLGILSYSHMNISRSDPSDIVHMFVRPGGSRLGSVWFWVKFPT